MWRKAFLVVLTFLAVLSFAKTPKDTLVIAGNTEIFITLDPAVCYETFASAVVEAAYAGLVKIEPVNGVFTPVPELAEKWEVVNKGDVTEWIFYLRKGLVFANGDPLTAEDVVFSFKRALTINKSPAWLFNELGLTAENMEQTIVKVDDGTVKLVTKPLAQSIVLSILSGPWAGVVNKKVVLANEVNGDLGQTYLTDKSAGAGPYQVIEWKRKEQVAMQANSRYWRGEPTLKRIIIMDVPEETTQFLLVQKGDVDVAWNITPEQAAQLRETNGGPVRLIVTASQSNEYVAMNAQWGPFKDERVRLAIKYAIDYDAIIKSVRRGFAILNQSFIPIGYLGFSNNNPFKRDVEKAKQLLAEAGYPNGFEVELLTNTTNIRQNEAVVIQANLAEIGIKANISLMPASEMYAKYRQQGTQIIVAGWGIDYPDTDNLAKPFADYRVKQLAWRNMWYDDYAADLAEKAGLEMDNNKRVEMYRELEKYWMEKGPFAMLYQPVNYWAVSSDVVGFEKAGEGYSLIFDFTKISKK
ncbi:ABC transporter substrate-binding protein [Pseudothermotoga lettingae]|jgi:peptide/nickel transport system substrate-binding protein|uniref:ABC transporter substrate-binding protein n=1 Tax=Pseudothermotoga lettingae TaxID=177758 RepID=UPI000747F1B8|nr:ABC transporter substrate-binding protein [Pseudothermotoga lettingae]KUK21126.1 MAG: Extracellular solute-binding protein family 5 [Pseudothermotoga lettingae]